MSEEETVDEAEKEQKRIIYVYAALVASLLLCLVPVFITFFAFLALVLFTGVFIAAYKMRRKAEESSLTTNHMTFIIRTIWIGSSLAIPTTLLASAYMLPLVDNSPIQNCMDNLMARSADIDIQACIDNYLSVNQTVFLIATVIAGGPAVIYFAYRLTKGISRALKSHHIDNVKKWF